MSYTIIQYCIVPVILLMTICHMAKYEVFYTAKRYHIVIYIYIHIYMYVYRCMCVCIYVCMYVSMYVCTYLFTSLFICSIQFLFI